AKSLKSPLNSMCASSFRDNACDQLSQFRHRDGLGQVPVGPHAHPQLYVLFRPFGADYDYRQVLSIQLRSHPADKLEAVHIGHPYVGQNEIELAVPDFVKRVLAVNCLSDVGLSNAVQSGKAHAEQLPESRRIIYNEKCFPHLASVLT